MTTRRQSNNQETILRSNWDNSGIDFKAFTVEVTDTASGPNSTVMDLRVDGISVGSLGKDGSLILPTPLPVASGGTGTDNNTDARTNLGLGSISTQDSSNVSITGGSITGITDLAIADGGTGASTAADARTNLGLGSISTQDSSNILITGGSITGITDLAIADGGTGASTAADARDNLVVVHRAGDTMTGDLTVGDGTAGFSVNIDGANSTDRSLTYLTNGSLRWEIVTNSDSESGLNEGSNFNLRRYNDAGSLIGNSINISRSTGDTTFENDIAVGDGFTMQPDATFSLGVKGLKTTSRSLQYFSGTTLRWEVLTNNSPEEDLTSPSIPTKLADPASLPTGNGWSVAFSPDGVHMAVAHFTSPFIAIYERSGNTFTKLANPATLPAGDARSAAFSPDGKHLVVAHAVSPFITIYERVGNTFTKLPNPATLPPDTGRSVSFSPDGKHLVVGHALTPHVTIYERSGNTFTKVADPAILPPNTVNGVAFSPDGNHLVAVHFDSPFLTIYERSGNTFTKLADPATTPASTGFAVAFSPNNTHIVVGHDVAPRITIYKISGNTFTKLPDPSSIPSGDVRGVAFSSDDVHMVATHLLSPFITVYERAGDTFTKLPDPSSLPTGTGRGATFSPDAGFMPIAHDTIPFITIYDSPVGVNTNGGSDFSIKRYGDGGTVIGEPIKIARETGLMSLQGLTSVESGGFTLSDGGIAPSDANVSFGIAGVNATNRTIEYFTGDNIRWKIEVNNSPEEDLTAPAVATKLANPATLPTGTGVGVAFSLDGTHLAVAHDTSPFITIYERSGNTFTKLANPATLPTGAGRDISFSPDGTHMAVAHFNSPFVTIYERSGNTFTKLANPATLPTGNGQGVSFSADGTHMAVAHATTPFITIYERSGNTFTKLADPATLPTGQGNNVAFSLDGVHMAVAHSTSLFITIYERSGNTFTKLPDPATLPAGQGEAVAFSPDGTYMAVAHFGSPFITIYKRSGNTFTKLADPATLPTGTGTGVAFSSDGSHLAVGHNSSPFVTIYERSGDTFTKLADPATLPTGNGRRVVFSVDGTHLAVAHLNSPFITIYDSPVGVNTNGGSDFSIKRYGDNGAIIGEPLKISRETGDTVFKGGNVGIDANSPSEKLQVKSGNILLDNNFSLLGFNPAGTFSRNLIKFDSANNLIIGDLSTSIINNTIIASGNGAGKSITLFTSAAERMRITDTGRVGIGTASPTRPLEVSSNDNTSVRVSTTASNRGTTIFMQNKDGGGLDQEWAVRSGSQGGTQNFRINDLTNNLNPFEIEPNTPNSTLYLDSTGNIGVGTNNPVSNISPGSRVIKLSSNNNTELILDHTDGGSTSDIGLVSFERGNVHLAHIRAAHDGAIDSALLSFHTQQTGESFASISDKERMRITGAGNVGIGTTTPLSRLHVSDGTVDGIPFRITGANGFNYNFRSLSDGTTDGRRLDIQIGSNDGQISFSDSNNEWMRITSTGNVGIGIATPGNKLSVNGITAAFSGVRFGSDGSGEGILRDASNGLAFTTGSFNVSFAKMTLTNAGNLGIGSTAPSQKLTVIGNFITGGDVETDATTKHIRYSGLHFTNSEEPVIGLSVLSDSANNIVNIGGGSSLGNAASITRFYTAPNQTTLTGTERMRITSTGEVGIGITTPRGVLDVAGASPKIVLTDTAGVDFGILATSDSLRFGTFSPTNTESSVVIQNGGNVGIGTTSPRVKLEIAGPDAPTTGAILLRSVTNLDAVGMSYTLNANNDVDLHLGRFYSGPHVAFQNDLTIDSLGNVGIGTTVAPKRLSILDNVLIKRNDNGPGTAGNLELRTSDTSPISGRILFGTDGTGWQFRIGEENAGASTITDHVTVVTGGNVGIGTTGPLAKLDVAGQIRADNVTGYGFRAPGDTDGGMRSPGDGIVTFVTNSVERVRIDANGNVGIGTGVPLGRLRVVGTAGPDRSVLIDNREIKFIGSGAAHFSIFGADTGRNRISISNSSTGPAPGIEDAELLVVTFQGNVGIGATAPASKLEVVGTITSTGLNVNNNLITNVATPVSATDAANKDYVDSTTANLANWELVTTNIAAENGDRLLVDTSSSSITVTMPASPVLGDEVRFADKAGTFASNNLTIARNGSPIQGLLEDLVVDVNNVDFALVFTNATDGWRLSDVSNIVTGADPATTTVFQFTATAGQTVFTGLDDNGFGLVYTPGFEVVFLNGVKLEFADYVRTDSNTITLVEAATVDDVLTVLAFGTFDIANVYTQAEADAAFVAQGELPSPAVADTYLRRNTANTAYEAESSLDVSNDLITSRDWRGKNAIINGNFDIWQRGTSFPITTGVTILTADRWSSTAQQGGTGAATVTRQDFPPGFTDVPGNPRFYLRHDQTIATSASTGYVVQKIESVRTFAGQTVTFSFWARDLSGPTTLAPFIIQNFGTGGSPSTSVFLEFSPFVVTTSFQRFEITINVPSISGKTVGTADNDHIQFGILQNSTTGFTTFTLDFAQAQVELGLVATEFERRPIGTELALCQRYFEKTYDLNTPPGTGANNGALNRRAYTTTAMIHDLVWRFNTRKRVVPTVIPFSNSTGAANIIRIGSNELAATSNFVGHTGTTFQITGNHAAAANDFVVCHGTADAEL